MKHLSLILLLFLSSLTFSQTIGNIVYIENIPYKWIDPFAKSDEWKAIETYADTNSLVKPTDYLQYDELIKDLKSAGIWQKLDVFYVFAGDGSNGFKLINWKNPNQHYADAYGGLTWDLDGIKGNGSNAYLNTNYVASTNGVNRVLGDASIFGVVTQTGGLLWGLADAWNADYFSINFYNKRLDGNFNNLPSVNQTGFHTIIRTSTTEGVYIHKDYVSETLTSTAQTGSSISSANSTIFRSTSAFGSAKLSCWATGGSLTYAETQTFRTIYNNFLTALGLTPVA